jgi:hypothetical protein
VHVIYRDNDGTAKKNDPKSGAGLQKITEKSISYGQEFHRALHRSDMNDCAFLTFFKTSIPSISTEKSEGLARPIVILTVVVFLRR